MTHTGGIQVCQRFNNVKIYSAVERAQDYLHPKASARMHCSANNSTTAQDVYVLELNGRALPKSRLSVCVAQPFNGSLESLSSASQVKSISSAMPTALFQTLGLSGRMRERFVWIAPNLSDLDADKKASKQIHLSANE